MTVNDHLNVGEVNGNILQDKQVLWNFLNELLLTGKTMQPRYLFVPGRIEIAGKHVDYLGGQSLVCATPFGLCVKILAREDSTFCLQSKGYDNKFVFTYDVSDTSQIALVNDWAHYPRVVLTRLCRLFPETCQGFDMAICSDLPAASGMSSSSALVVAVFLAFQQVNRLYANDTFRRNVGTREELCQFLGCLENGAVFKELGKGHGVGTHGGSQDHVAIFTSEQHFVHLNSYDPVVFVQKVSFPTYWRFVIANSGVIAQKTADVLLKFNHLVADGKVAMTTLIDKDILQENVDEIIRKCGSKRLKQFLSESYKIAPGMLKAFLNSDEQLISEYALESQTMTEHTLQNQIPETIFLAKHARELDAFGASAFGAGFGGAVWAIVHKDRVKSFSSEWINSYRRAFPMAPQGDVYIMQPGTGAKWVNFE